MTRPAIRKTFAVGNRAEDEPDSVMDMIKKARLVAERNVPAFIPGLRASNIYIENRQPTMAIDKYWRTYWNERAVVWMVKAAEAVSPQFPCPTCGKKKHARFAYLGGVWIHEVGHPTFRHWERMEEAGFKNPGKWNVAMDAAMNDDIPEMGMQAEKWCELHPKDPFVPAICLPSKVMVDPVEYALWNAVGEAAHHAATGKDFWDIFKPMGNYPGHIVVPFLVFPEAIPSGGDYLKMERYKIGEYYYENIPDAPPKGAGEMADHGSGSDGEPREWEFGDPSDSNNPPGTSQAESQGVRRDIAKNIKNEKSKGRGHIPGEWDVWADSLLLPPKVRWQDKLKARTRKVIASLRAGATMTSFRRPSRTSIVTGFAVAKPITLNTKLEVIVVIDTSGSMGQGRGSVLERAISEAEGILKCCKVNVRIIDCDAAVYGKAQAVKSMKQADLHGGGGTNMVTGILAALNSKPRPDMIVLITDGGTNWPTIQQLQGVKMVTCIIGGGLGDCPPFMNPILVDD